jgi:hypothetical protein
MLESRLIMSLPHGIERKADTARIAPAALLLLGLAAMAADKAGERVALDFGLTVDAVTQATPGIGRGVKPPHLRKEKKRAPFMVPSGVRNIALFRPVSSSEQEPVTGDVDQITDGLKKSGQFDFVELGPGRHWVQVDLGDTRTLYAIVIWHFYKNAVIYNDVIVQVAEDAAFSRNVRTLFNNDHDNSSGMGKGSDTAYCSRWWGEVVDTRGKGRQGTRARYVRVYTAEGMEEEPVRFVEISVYGK